MTTDLVPGVGTNGTVASDAPVPEDLTVKSSQTSVRLLTTGGTVGGDAL